MQNRIVTCGLKAQNQQNTYTLIQRARTKGSKSTEYLHFDRTFCPPPPKCFCDQVTVKYWYPGLRRGQIQYGGPGAIPQ